MKISRRLPAQRLNLIGDLGLKKFVTHDGIKDRHQQKIVNEIDYAISPV
jgi:type IV secretory pathway VirD2 relaxase